VKLHKKEKEKRKKKKEKRKKKKEKRSLNSCVLKDHYNFYISSHN